MRIDFGKYFIEIKYASKQQHQSAIARFNYYSAPVRMSNHFGYDQFNLSIPRF